MTNKTGYGKPPQHSRFKSGQSGNPKGRPKGTKNFATEIEAELNTSVPVTENGKRKRVSKRKIIVKQLVNKGAAGDQKAMTLLLQHDRNTRAEADVKMEEPLSLHDELTMDSIIGRILKRHGPTAENQTRDASVTSTNHVLDK